MERGRKSLYSLHKISKEVDDGKGKRKILDNISINICAGEFYGIVGKSGAGKSTLLNVLGGMDSISDGKLYFNDREMPSIKNRHELAMFRRKIGFVFQSFQLIEHLSVYENVALPLRLGGVANSNLIKQKVEASLLDAGLLQAIPYFFNKNPTPFIQWCNNYRISIDCLQRFFDEREKITLIRLDEASNDEIISLGEHTIFQLKQHWKSHTLTPTSQEKLRQSPSTLSGGEKQRVAIARSLVNNPKVILADEPTGSLDSHNQDIVLNLLKKIHAQRDDITIILVSHSQTVIDYCTKVIELSDGKLIKEYTN
jgi:ABC-type lipoprotein export system ATPase subunit